MSTTIIPKSLAQHMAETIPLDCCEGAHAVVTISEVPHFLSSTTKEHTTICSKCRREVSLTTFTVLRPTL